MTASPRSLATTLLFVVLGVGAWFLAQADRGDAERIERQPTAPSDDPTEPTAVPDPIPAERRAAEEAPKPEDASPPPTDGPPAEEERPVVTGRALLADGTPLAGFRIEARKTTGPPARGERAEADGSFSLPLAEGLEVDVHVDELKRARLDPIGGPQTVIAPYDGLELRYDALLITLELPNSVLADLGEIEGFVTEAYGAADAPFSSRSMFGGSPFDSSRVLTRLLPAGPGYAFKVPLRDGPTLVALVPPGTPSGRVTAQLAHEHPDLGAVRVRFPEGGVTRPDRISVRFTPVLEDDEPPRWDEGVSVAEPTNEAVSPGLLPGRYRVRPHLFDLPPFLHAEAVASVAEIDVAAGAVADVEVSLRLGGRIELRVDANAGGFLPPIRLERRDEAGEWKRVGLVFSRGNRVIHADDAPLGVDFWTENVLPPGTVHVRLRGDGWVTVEEDLEIVSGVETPWNVTMQRER